MMDARAKKATDLFLGRDRYFVPAYQRPYVWTEERQWSPLWEDIARLADGRLEGRADIHFLGAIVIRLESNDPGGLTLWSVIDGQQRLTTLQILISALATAAEQDGIEGQAALLRDLTLHKEQVAQGDEQLRFWPTTVNQDAYRAVMQVGGPDPQRDDDSNNTIEEAWEFFRERAREYAGNVGEDSSEFEPENALATRYGALNDAVTDLLQLVSITLEPGDPAQVIFETLNARGTPLLAIDLVKNALFDKAERAGHELDSIHAEHWAKQLGDDDYWSGDERLGRLTVPRSQAFLMHWTAMKLGEIVSAENLFDRFRRQFVDGAGSADPIELLDELNADAAIVRGFAELDRATPAGSFLAALRDLDTTTFHPVALALLRMDIDPERRGRAFSALESFLIRRMMLGLKSNNYSQLSAALVRRLIKDPEHADEVIVEELLTSQSESFRWPTDQALLEHLTSHQMYGWLGQGKIVAILSALELAQRAGKTEGITALPAKLEVEHVMPRAWKTHWSLGDEATEEESEFRETHINRLGNLTLVSGRLNGSMSNGAWPTKRKALDEHSILMLNKQLAATEAWDESAIDERGNDLAEQLVGLWPGPQEYMPEGWSSPDAELSAQDAGISDDEFRELADAATPFLWALITDLCENVGKRRTYEDIELSIGWPSRRLSTVMSGYYRKYRHFEDRRPWHLNFDADGVWWMWMDEESAEQMAREVERKSSGVKTIEELREMIVPEAVRDLIDLLPARFAAEADGWKASAFPRAQVKSPLSGANGYFARNWLFLWLKDRFEGDQEWYAARLSKPEEVRVDAYGRLRVHLAGEADLEVLIEGLKATERALASE